MMGKITTSCRREGSRYTRLNLLGWAMLCPHALNLLWHGSTPLDQPSYPTAEESKKPHDNLVRLVNDIFLDVVKPCSRGGRRKPCIVSGAREYDLVIGFRRGTEQLCALSKADLVYILDTGYGLMNLYIDVSSSSINRAKPWQVLLRATALYYESLIPVGVIIASPQKVMYKLLAKEDQKRIHEKIIDGKVSYKKDPNLCSLCELADYCPHREV